MEGGERYGEGGREREGERHWVGCTCVHVYTVEPLIKDTLNKGHLSIKDTCFDPMLILSCII